MSSNAMGALAILVLEPQVISGKMVMGKSLVLITVVVLGLSSMIAAVPGTATFYTPPYIPSACFGNQDKGVMIAAASDAIWNRGKACGHKYSVRCTGPTNQGVPRPCRGGSVTVTIVDYCPPGCRGTIDLSQEAFAKIANPDAGKIKIEYASVKAEGEMVDIVEDILGLQ